MKKLLLVTLLLVALFTASADKSAMGISFGSMTDTYLRLDILMDSRVEDRQMLWNVVLTRDGELLASPLLCWSHGQSIQLENGLYWDFLAIPIEDIYKGESFTVAFISMMYPDELFYFFVEDKYTITRTVVGRVIDPAEYVQSLKQLLEFKKSTEYY